MFCIIEYLYNLFYLILLFSTGEVESGSVDRWSTSKTAGLTDSLSSPAMSTTMVNHI